MVAAKLESLPIIVCQLGWNHQAIRTLFQLQTLRFYKTTLEIGTLNNFVVAAKPSAYLIAW